MNFDNYIYGGQVIGHYIQTMSSVFFFGNHNLKKEDLPKIFSNFKFHEVKQVHGNKLVKASDDTPEADALWTDQRNVALLIKTADCMPLLLSQGNKVMAIHSGWRGTLMNILESSIKAEFDVYAPMTVSCGPFIQQQSFEVDSDLAKQFSMSFPKINELYFESTVNSQKCYLDLKKVIERQLEPYSLEGLFFSDIDTKTSLEHASYRRDKDKAGRNYSFVARLND